MTATAKQVVAWTGANAGMTDIIVRQLGTPDLYIEAFAGGLSTMLALPYPARRLEYACDLNPELINLLMVLASHRWLELASLLDRTLAYDGFVSDNERQDIEDALHDECGVPDSPFAVNSRNVELAYLTFCRWWMGKGGTPGGPREGEISIRFTPGGGAMPTRFRQAVKAIPWFHKRLERVHFHHGDAIAFIKKLRERNSELRDREGTAIYADPTFIGRDNLYNHALESRSAGGIRVGDDHDRLAEALNSLERARVVLRYYDDPRLETLYPRERWNRISAERTQQIKSESSAGASHSATTKDVLLVNGPILGTEHDNA